MNLQENINRIKVLMETNVDSSDTYYHGTDNPNFNDDELKINERGLIFFTKHKEIAYRYAMNFDYPEKSEPDYGHVRILSYHLNVKNTFDPEQYSDDPEYIELLADTGDFSTIQHQRGGIRDYEEAASEALYDGDWSVLESRPFIEALKEKGFDSIYIDNSPHYKINHNDEIFTGKDIAIFYPELAIPVKNKYD